jgi:hypothetical protein
MRATADTILRRLAINTIWALVLGMSGWAVGRFPEQSRIVSVQREVLKSWDLQRQGRRDREWSPGTGDQCEQYALEPVQMAAVGRSQGGRRSRMVTRIAGLFGFGKARVLWDIWEKGAAQEMVEHPPRSDGMGVN